jgi:hypothetical protein
MSQISAQPTNKHMECIDYKFANRENSKTVTAKNNQQLHNHVKQINSHISYQKIQESLYILKENKGDLISSEVKLQTLFERRGNSRSCEFFST